MALLIKQDTYKINIDRKVGLFLMSFTAAILFFFIIANFYWVYNYNANDVADRIATSSNPNPTVVQMDGFVRFRVILAIVGNTLALGTFTGMVWWGLEKRRFGLGFGVFWLIIFGTNAIATPFYSVQIDSFSIITLVLNVLMAFCLVYWLANLLNYRTRLKQEIARRRR